MGDNSSPYVTINGRWNFPRLRHQLRHGLPVAAAEMEMPPRMKSEGPSLTPFRFDCQSALRLTGS